MQCSILCFSQTRRIQDLSGGKDSRPKKGFRISQFEHLPFERNCFVVGFLKFLRENVNCFINPSGLCFFALKNAYAFINCWHRPFYPVTKVYCTTISILLGHLSTPQNVLRSQMPRFASDIQTGSLDNIQLKNTATWRYVHLTSIKAYVKQLSNYNIFLAIYIFIFTMQLT